MKKQLSLLAAAVALVGFAPAYAETNWGARAGSSVDLSSAPATRTRQNVNYSKYQTRTNTTTYDRQDGRNIYYTQPANRSALYKQYAANGSSQTVRTSRSETVRTELKRKYYLAHPFYQPLQGKFGSVTDLSYGASSYDAALNNMIAVSPFDSMEGLTPKRTLDQFAIKEDLSFGITDKIALVGMLRYENNKNKIDWPEGINDDKWDESTVNLYGLGAQFRIIDTANWIGELAAYFEHQKDVANDYILEFKAGYKVARSTIYGLARAWYVDVDGDALGDDIEVEDGNIFIVQLKDDHAFYVEGGLGVFSVLDEDWTLNVEGIFGHYDWHDQFSIKGEFGWQPNDWFALTAYARASLYDSADGKNLEMYAYTPSTDPDFIGKAKVDNNQEWSLGLRAIFQF